MILRMQVHGNSTQSARMDIDMTEPITLGMTWSVVPVEDDSRIEASISLVPASGTQPVSEPAAAPVSVVMPVSEPVQGSHLQGHGGKSGQVPEADLFASMVSEEGVSVCSAWNCQGVFQ